ncbi:tRNA adenosine(34) deaminase TadA [Liquorilactobacillus hordei]|uniref:tRNA-specific adenosine deaminase n=2 Tax=Liquorilactobacillus hordei TaxID=468911 RepID=A0A0R1MN97_9LACO|nr:tRNA adenosine(34) deaminase TadA [Liquorilactobacillus hordei]KRL06554.1 cytosine adenosine deaminase [Liquorilactobacillus hordei DSM 19519]
MILSDLQKEFFMKEAIYEAKKAATVGEVPIGCVIVMGDKIVGRGHNLREHAQDATMHAEILAIQEANAFCKSWRLPEAQLFVTLEPCPMCSGAILNSRIERVYYGAMDPKAGTVGSLMNLLDDHRFNHQVIVEKGCLENECAQMLKSFFRDIRLKKKKSKRKD